MPPNTREAPEISPEILDILELISQAVHQISHDIHRAVDFLDRHGPVLDAYQRGGILAARTARRQANGKRD